MADIELNKDDFQKLAKIYGVSSDPNYLDDLRQAVQLILATVETLQKVDVGNINPALQFMPGAN